MQLALTIITCVVSVLLILVILIQQRGTGLGRAFGGDSAVYRTRRGAERFLFWATIFFAVIFAVVALAKVLVSK